MKTNVTNSTGQTSQNNGSVHHDNTSQHQRQQLPNEIISLIIDHIPEYLHSQILPEWALVNKQFYSIVNPLIWQYSPFCGSGRSLERFLNVFLLPNDDDDDTPSPRQTSLGRLIQNLQIVDKSWNDDRLIRFLPLVPCLKNMWLCPSNCSSLTEKSLQHVPLHCQQLQSLRLTNPMHVPPHFISNFRHLICLDLDVCADLTAEWLDRCTTLPLEHLGLEVRDDILENDDALVPILQKFTHLKTLDISDATTEYEYQRHLQLTGLGMSHFMPQQNPLLLPDGGGQVMYWPHLTRLNLSKMYGIDDTIWIPFIKRHPRLQSVRLFKTYLTDASMDAMILGLPDLTSLVLDEDKGVVTSEAARRLVRQCPKLRDVTYQWCAHIRGDLFPEADCGSGPGDQMIVLYESGIAKIKASPA